MKCQLQNYSINDEVKSFHIVEEIIFFPLVVIAEKFPAAEVSLLSFH